MRGVTICGIFLVLCLFFLGCGGPEALGPPPPLDTSFAIEDNGRIKLVAKTAPGAEVSFGRREERWPQAKRIQADSAGLAEYLTGRMPPTVAETSVFVSAHGKNTKAANSWLKVRRPSELVSSLGSGLECRPRSCRVAGPFFDGFTVSAPEGTQVTFAGKAFVVEGERLRIKMSQEEILQGVPLTKVFAKGNDVVRSFPVTLEFPDGETLSGELPVKAKKMRKAVAQIFSKAERQMVEVPGGTTGTALLKPAGEHSVLLGKAKSLSDIRYVAVIKSKDRRASCGTYYQDKTANSRTIWRSYGDAVVKIYDRTTGEVVRQKEFRARPLSCPRKARRSLSSSYDPEAVSRWLKRQSS